MGFGGSSSRALGGFRGSRFGGSGGLGFRALGVLGVLGVQGLGFRVGSRGLEALGLQGFRDELPLG